MLISHDYVMFYDVLSQNGQRPRLIRNSPAKDQSAFASAHRLILRFIALSRAFFFSVSSRVGRPPLLALRFLHSWFPMTNPITKPRQLFLTACSTVYSPVYWSSGCEALLKRHNGFIMVFTITRALPKDLHA
jgi:hypothetical protein